MAVELESSLQDIAAWDKKWLVNFNTRNSTYFVNGSNNTGATDLKC